MKVSKEMQPYLLTFLRWLVGCLFLMSGFSKLSRPSEFFEVAIHFYEIAPESLVPALALVIPVIESLFGLYLLLGYWVSGSAFVLLALTVSFQVVLGQAVARNLPVDECGCFGGGLVHLSLRQSFLLDTVLAAILLWISTSSPHKLSLDGYLSRKWPSP